MASTHGKKAKDRKDVLDTKVTGEGDSMPTMQTRSMTNVPKSRDIADVVQAINDLDGTEEGVSQVYLQLMKVVKNKMTIARIRRSVNDDEFFWASMESILEFKDPPVSLKDLNAEERYSVNSWREAIALYNNRKNPEYKDSSKDSKKTERPVRAKIGKLDIDMPKFNGKRGFCGVWLEDFLLQMSTNTGKVNTIPEDWLAVAVSCVKHEESKARLLNLMKDNPNLTPAETLEAFVKIEDRKSLRMLRNMYKVIKQKDNESIRNYSTRFDKLLRALRRQDYDVTKKQANVDFKYSIIMADKAEEHNKTDITEIVDYIEGLELVNNMGTAKKITESTSIFNVVTKDYIHDDEGWKRCAHCCKKGPTKDKVHSATKCYDRRNGKPKTTLKQRLKLEIEAKARKTNNRESTLMEKMDKLIEVVIASQGKKNNNVGTVQENPIEGKDRVRFRGTDGNYYIADKTGTVIGMEGKSEAGINMIDLKHSESDDESDNDTEYYEVDDGIVVRYSDMFPDPEKDPERSVVKMSDIIAKIEPWKIRKETTSMLYSSRTKIKIQNGQGYYVENNALWDSGAEKKSYISLKLVKELGLISDQDLQPSTHLL
mmetsp:Transcript_13535/g.20333  ORF Transcript_13535/g.20333 Transcript_13535/m.20333 type:complete len:598 (+) Transcript_13535:672-2465(+)